MPTKQTDSDLPTLAELMERGNRASEKLWVIVDEFCQERQTLFYNIRSVRIGVERLHDGKPVIMPP